MKDKGLIIAAPVSVMVLVLLLIVIYGWVGTAPVVTGEWGSGYHGPPAPPSGIPAARTLRFPQRPVVPTVAQPTQAAPSGGYMGVRLADVPTAALSAQPAGVYVTEVIPGSPAAQAGVRSGDRLLRCSHRSINAHGQVGDLLAGKRAGDVVKLLVQRGAYKRSYYIRLGIPPAGLLTGPGAGQPALSGGGP